jgi:hypothetical protein
LLYFSKCFTEPSVELESGDEDDDDDDEDVEEREDNDERLVLHTWSGSRRFRNHACLHHTPSACNFKCVRLTASLGAIKLRLGSVKAIFKQDNNNRSLSSRLLLPRSD